MSLSNRIKTLIGTLLVGMTCCFSPLLLAAAVEQTVRLSVNTPADGSQCQVEAVFKGDHDNCKLDDAKGRDNCSKESGCVCTRQEKHVSWKMDGGHAFSVVFDQGASNPFVTKGQSECNFKSNKKGQLRCRIKGKEVPKGHYDYAIEVADCKPARSRVEVY